MKLYTKQYTKYAMGIALAVTVMSPAWCMKKRKGVEVTDDADQHKDKKQKTEMFSQFFETTMQQEAPRCSKECSQVHEKTMQDEKKIDDFFKSISIQSLLDKLDLQQPLQLHECLDLLHQLNNPLVIKPTSEVLTKLSHISNSNNIFTHVYDYVLSWFNLKTSNNFFAYVFATTLEEKFNPTFKRFIDSKKQPKTLTEHSDNIIKVIQLKDGNLAFCYLDNTIEILKPNDDHIVTLKGHKFNVNSFIQLHNGNIVSGSSDGEIKIWNLKGECLATLTDHKFSVNSIIQLHNGNIASGSNDNTIKIWKLDGTCVATLSGHTSWVKCIIQLHNDNIASGSNDNTIKIWNPNTYKCIATLTDIGNEKNIYCITQLQNGNIASGSNYGTIKIWSLPSVATKSEGRDPNTYKCIATLSGHTSTVACIIQLKNGSFASCSWDKTIKIWKLNGTCVATLSGHTSWVLSIIQLQNGNIMSYGMDYNVKIWSFWSMFDTTNLTPQQLMLCYKLDKIKCEHKKTKMHNAWWKIFESFPGSIKEYFKDTVVPTEHVIL